MGYEVKLYYGECNSRPLPGEQAAYFSVVGMIDLCKIGDGQVEQLDSTPAAIPVYFYGTDGDTQILNDCYDRAMRVHPVKDVLKALRADHKADKYRRYAIAIATLAEAAKHFPHLLVVFYGH